MISETLNTLLDSMPKACDEEWMLLIVEIRQFGHPNVEQIAKWFVLQLIFYCSYFPVSPFSEYNFTALGYDKFQAVVLRHLTVYQLSQGWPSPVERRGKGPRISKHFRPSTHPIHIERLLSPNSEARYLRASTVWHYHNVVHILSLPTFWLWTRLLEQSLPNLHFHLLSALSLLNISFLPV